MGSYTEIKGQMKVTKGILTDEVYNAFLKEFGYQKISRKNRSSDYQIEGLTRDENTLKLETSWKNTDFMQDIQPWLAFFANRGIFFTGRFDCSHEYGDLYGVEVVEDSVTYLQGYVAYKRAQTVKLRQVTSYACDNISV